MKAGKGAIAGKPQACCPSYCGECPDYDTCKRVRGQYAEGACCPIKFLSLECGGPEKTPMNVEAALLGIQLPHRPHQCGDAEAAVLGIQLPHRPHEM